MDKKRMTQLIKLADKVLVSSGIKTGNSNQGFLQWANLSFRSHGSYEWIGPGLGNLLSGCERHP